MRPKSLRLSMRVLGAAGSALLVGLTFPGCGGGGGGSGTKGDLTDPTITVVGTPGQLSQTPETANSNNGTSPPPSFSSTVPTLTSTNNWFRFELPYDLVPSSVLGTDPTLKPFSYLNGNVTVTGVRGEHIPGMAMVNGVDAFGVSHVNDNGFPHDVVNGHDRNLGRRTFLYVADVDGNLSTPAAWGYKLAGNGQRLEIQDSAQHDGGALDTVRINVDSMNGLTVHAAWSFHIGAAADTRVPYVVSISSETRDPTDPLNAASVASTGSLIVEFSKPMVPRTVGHSATLDGFPFDANLPNPATSPPNPDTTITATVNTKVGKLFVPFDCTPINRNNLATYRLRPLINLPSQGTIDVLIRSLTKNNGKSAIDLAGNFYDGQDANNDSVPDGVDLTSTFSVGPGQAIVNIPVSPEVVYWIPATGSGIGAVDLNGRGFGTNTPGANASNRDLAALVTKPWLDFNGCEANPGGINLSSGIGLLAHPGNLATPTDPCTMQPMKDFAHNRFWYPQGLGSFPFNATANAARSEVWEDAQDPGNPGTPFPGVNEGSSGFETLCRDNTGSPILTGSSFGQVGAVQDMIVGEFLDRVYYDHFNTRAGSTFHVSFFGGLASTMARNTIADPPCVNPPPTHYWMGLPQIDVVLDQNNPTNPALVIEGDEVFTGLRLGGLAAGQTANAARTNSFIHLKPNPINPNAADQQIFPGTVGATLGNGPGGQSATAVYTFASRQQIGNFLYATDATTRELHAINSNTMRVITSISLPDPTGLAITPDMEYLYVTNFSDDSFSVVGADPTSPNFHKELARVRTGAGPRAIAVQPENEDVFVCNYNANTVSIVDPKSLTIRKTLDALVDGPYDIEVTERQEQQSAPHPFGWACGLYFAYFTNFIGNSVVVYESGPDGPQGIGIDNIRGQLPLDDSVPQIVAPRGLCFSPFADPIGLLAGGVFVAHQDENGFGRVSHIQFTQQAIFGPLPIQPPPGYFIPPGFTTRVFQVTGAWGDTDASRLVGHLPMDVALADLNVAGYQGTPSAAPNGGGVGVPPKPEQTGFINSKNHMRLVSNGATAAWAPDRLYVAFEDSDAIQVLDPRQAGVVVNTIEGHGAGGTKRLTTFWRE
jgi:hypothetical protein